ncbi:gallidermin/nisin family lantibiotic [Guptibacillus hwajinpoensis]|uniref:Lantibiotic n=1 Tax=Guptibacillus hwajinpoensis TaxID=208199 RepID=A0A0J6CXJ4_9BACL|nr:gallidermin/nisin family lantibiotic [Alkalihalobacillus macyae]KMM36764.1 antibiotic protein [Alkalihalobacillus macyae]
MENAKNAFDLDLEVTKSKDVVEPNITSYSFCTPGCGETGSFNSYCC